MESKLITGTIVEKKDSLTLEEFSRITKARRELIIEMVEYQLIHPAGNKIDEWRFDSLSIKRGRLASSFYHELEVNMQGIALAFDLLDKLEELKHEMATLKKTKFK